MKVLTDIIARVLFILPLVAFGFGHFANANDMAGMVPIPGGVFWIYLTGLALLAAAVSIIIKKKAALATLLLGVMLIIFALMVWMPGMSSEDPAQAQMSMGSMLKDIGLAGAAFFMSGVFKKEEDAA
jgi:uncharacterized membrane protein